MRVLEQEGTFDCSALDLPVEEKDLPLKGVQCLGFGVEATALSFQTKFEMLETSELEVLQVSQKQNAQDLGVTG